MSTLTENQPLATPDFTSPPPPSPIIARKIETLKSLVATEVGASRQPILQPILDTLFEFHGTPASGGKAKHGAYDGGLICHILDVANIALKSIRANRDYLAEGQNIEDLMALDGSERAQNAVAKLGECSPESIVIVAILHDLEKVHDLSGQIKYVPNILKKGERSDKIPYKSSDAYDPLREAKQALDTLSLPASSVLFAHCSESIFPSGLVSLSVAEQMSPGIVATLNEAEIQAVIYHAGLYDRAGLDGYMNKEHPLTLTLHYADMMAYKLLS